MKKFYVMALACLTASTAFAADFSFEPSTNPWFGVTVGYVSSQLKVTQTNDSKATATTTTTGILGETKKTFEQKELERDDKATHGVYKNTTPDRDYSTGLQVGLTFNPEFKYGIGIKTGVLYECAINQGYLYTKDSFTGKELSSLIEYKDSYLSLDHAISIPVQLSWRVEVCKDFSLFVYTGIALDVHIATYSERTISSNTSVTEGSKTESIATEVKQQVKGGYFTSCGYNENGLISEIPTSDKYSSKYSYKCTSTLNGEVQKEASTDGWLDTTIDYPISTRLNVLWAVGAGLQYKGLRLTVGGQFGLNNLVINNEYGRIYSARVNKPFEISLSYMFLDKKK